MPTFQEELFTDGFDFYISMPHLETPLRLPFSQIPSVEQFLMQQGNGLARSGPARHGEGRRVQRWSEQQPQASESDDELTEDIVKRVICCF